MVRHLPNAFLLSIAFITGIASLGMAQGAPVTRVEQDDASITYSGNWYNNGSPSNSGASAALTNAAGARAVVTFTGTAITWIGVADPWSGLANVYVDGTLYRV